MGQYIINSGTLYRIAITAYKRTESAESDKIGGQDDALVALIFSAAALESHICDLSLLAKMLGELFPTEAKDILALANILDDIEKSNGSPKLKYRVAKVVLSKQAYDLGCHPYQDFHLLFRLRNAIVHYKPEKISETAHSFIKELHQRGLCNNFDSHIKGSWLAHVSTRAVARWACNVACDMVGSIQKSLPQITHKNGSSLQQMLLIGGACFKRVE